MKGGNTVKDYLLLRFFLALTKSQISNPITGHMRKVSMLTGIVVGGAEVKNIASP